MASVTRTAVKPLQGGVGYELAGVEEWAAEAVEATFDGGGAAGDFLACLSLYSPGGALMSRSFPDDAITAGDTAKVTYAPFLRKTGGATAAASTGLPFCYAATGDYNAPDFYGGGAPDPLTYNGVYFTDAATFGEGGSPGNSDVQILRSGLYQCRLTVSPYQTANTFSFDPGYNWDIATYMFASDAGGAFFVGLDSYTGTSAPIGWTPYWHPRDNFGAPNGVSVPPAYGVLGELASHFQFLDSETFPVNINASFRHGLNDADVTNSFQFALWVFRLSDAVPSLGDP